MWKKLLLIYLNIYNWTTAQPIRDGERERGALGVGVVLVGASRPRVRYIKAVKDMSAYFSKQAKRYI